MRRTFILLLCIAAATTSRGAFDPDEALLNRIGTMLPGARKAVPVPKLPDNLFAASTPVSAGNRQEAQNAFSRTLSPLRVTCILWAPVSGMSRSRMLTIKNPDGSSRMELQRDPIPPEEQPTHQVVINGYVLRVGSYLPRSLVPGTRIRVVNITQDHVRLEGEIENTGYRGEAVRTKTYADIAVDAHDSLTEP
jgi:hypothetical protein